MEGFTKKMFQIKFIQFFYFFNFYNNFSEKNAVFKNSFIKSVFFCKMNIITKLLSSCINTGTI